MHPGRGDVQEDGQDGDGGEMMNFTIGRDNLALTVFVPWDCGNNCFFCTSKQKYAAYKADLKNLFIRKIQV